MRKSLIAAFMVAGVAVAQDDPFKSGEALQAEIAKDCAEGCVVFSRQQASEFERQLGEILTSKQAEAFEAGVRFQKSACASLI
jgi:hypothetical protein